MRIVIDMQGAQTESRFRGIGRYAMGLSKALVKTQGGRHEFILALNGMFPETIEPVRAEFDSLLSQESIRVWTAPGPVDEQNVGNDGRRRVAEIIRESFISHLRPDVVHLTSLFEGYVDNAVTSIGAHDRVAPNTVSLHDLIPMLNADRYIRPYPGYEAYYMRKLQSLKRAVMCFTNSESTRREALDTLGIPEDSVVNVSSAVGSEFKKFDPDPSLLTRLLKGCGITRPFVMYTGGADERKNLSRLMEAFSLLPPALRAEHQLVICGRIVQSEEADLWARARAVGLSKGDLCLTGYVSDSDLLLLYNACKLFVFPSWHEGFGLPALEAMACGAPVICANSSSLPEVVGLDRAMFDPLNVNAISAKLCEVLEDSAFRAALIEHGLERAKQFSWEESAARMMAALESRLSEGSDSGRRRQFLDRPTLAYVSPLPPQRTGVADYSAELLAALDKYYDIELIVDQAGVTSPESMRKRVHDSSWLRDNIASIDRVLYQFGNSPYHDYMLPLLRDIPGIVVMHDFFMSGWQSWREIHAGVEGAWVQALFEAHGYIAVCDRFQDPEMAKLKYPANLEVLQLSQGIIVHSEWAKGLAQRWYEESVTRDWHVIPHLRVAAASFDRKAARNRLGIDEDEFVVCAFGFLDVTKLNHRLIEAWSRSELGRDNKCRLFFVGENHGGDYGASLVELIQRTDPERIVITGYVEKFTYLDYLRSADLAVQLRAEARGETSGTALDCMAHGLPVIVNANGSMEELGVGAVKKLPDVFEDAELVQALETLREDDALRQELGATALEEISTRYSPANCASKYFDAIETSNGRSAGMVASVICAIGAAISYDVEAAGLMRLSRAIADSIPEMRAARRIFLDVTATHTQDHKSGVERVVRGLISALLASPPAGFRIEPVYLSNAGGPWHHRRACKFTLKMLGRPEALLEDEPIEPRGGDLLISLDISGSTLCEAAAAGLFQRYRNVGATVFSVIHDILPVQMPEVFPPGTNEIHTRWLQEVSRFDGVACVSRSVADDFGTWRLEEGFDETERRPFRTEWFHNGVDLEMASTNMIGVASLPPSVAERLAKRPTFLMVGTIEPRKGYLQTLDAFELLWQSGVDVNLLVVGREGWRDLPEGMRRDIPRTVQRLESVQKVEERLTWLDDASDDLLQSAYVESTCLIAASFGEGFGLPLIEAARYGIPILARDIPIFREVAGQHATFFHAENASEFAMAVEHWLELNRDGKARGSSGLPYLNWQQSAERLLNACLGPNRKLTGC